MSDTSRRAYVLSGACLAIGTLAGCLGDSEPADEQQTTDDSTTPGGGGESNGSGVTIQDWNEPGQYTFDVEGGGALSPDQLRWDVRAIDGNEATVVATAIYDHTENEVDLTVTPDTLADEVFQHFHNYDYLVDTIFPFRQIGDVNLEALSVGDDWDGGSGSTMQVTESTSHAGLDCLVIEHTVGETLLSSWCVSVDHRMVIRGTSTDPEYTLTLAEWQPS